MGYCIEALRQVYCLKDIMFPLLLLALSMYDLSFCFYYEVRKSMLIVGRSAAGRKEPQETDDRSYNNFQDNITSLLINMLKIVILNSTHCWVNFPIQQRILLILPITLF